MSKTAPIPDDAHALIIDKQAELKRKHKITVKISDLIAMCIKDSIKRTEKLLGFKSDEKSYVVETKQDIVSDKKKTNDSERDLNIVEEDTIKVTQQ